MEKTGKFFQLFLSSRRADLHRIARKSGGEYTVDDVSAEAWLIADEIERKRGFPVDFSDADDQQLALSWLYSKIVNFTEKNVRFAVKLDEGWDSDESDEVENILARWLAAPEQFDPLLILQAKQEQNAPFEFVKRSYSQAAAYVILLCRFDWDLGVLAGHLRVVVPTVQKRMIASGEHVKRQPSLFDKIQTVSYDFVATQARDIVRRQSQVLPQGQLGFAFV